MNEVNAEKVSMLADGEVEKADFDQVLDQLSKAGQLQQHWQDYHIIGDAMRRSLPETMNFDVAASVAKAIASEPSYLLPQMDEASPQQTAIRQAKVATLPRRTVPAVGFALAASLSALAIFNMGSFSPATDSMPVQSLAANTAIVANAQMASATRAEGPLASAAFSSAQSAHSARVVLASAGQNVATNNVNYPQEAADFYDYLVNYSRYSQSSSGNDMLRHVSLASY